MSGDLQPLILLVLLIIAVLLGVIAYHFVSPAAMLWLVTMLGWWGWSSRSREHRREQ